MRCSVVSGMSGAWWRSRCAPTSHGRCARPSHSVRSDASMWSSLPGWGESRKVNACRATALPAEASTWHWLRTMFLWCGIIFVDQGVGLFRWLA